MLATATHFKRLVYALTLKARLYRFHNCFASHLQVLFPFKQLVTAATHKRLNQLQGGFQWSPCDQFQACYCTLTSRRMHVLAFGDYQFVTDQHLGLSVWGFSNQFQSECHQPPITTCNWSGNTHCSPHDQWLLDVCR